MNLKHGHDVTTIANAMLLGAEEKEYLGRLPVGHGIVRLQGRWYKPFLVKFPLLQVDKGKVTDYQLGDQSPGSSGLRREILSGEGKKEEILAMRAAEILTKEEIELLKDVMGDITCGVVDRYFRLAFSSYFGNKLTKSLVSKSLIQPVGIATGKGRVKMLWLTEKGKEALKDLGMDVPTRGRGGPEHEYWKERVAQHLRNLGYSVEVELSIGESRTIDLVARKNQEIVAIEIETGQSNVVENVRKCLAAEYQRVTVLTTSRSLVPAVWRKLRAVQGLPLDRVEVQDVQPFLLNRNWVM